MAKILAISGSPRKGGNTDTLLGRYAAGAEEAGASVEQVYLRDYLIEPCVGCERCRDSGRCQHWHDGMDLLYPKIEESSGLILGSPVHNYNISSILKVFIDRLYPFYIASGKAPRRFSSRLAEQGRRAIVFAVGEQKSRRDSALVLPAMALPLEALGYSVLWQRTFRGFFEQNSAEHSPKALKDAFETGFHFAEIQCQEELGKFEPSQYLPIQFFRFPYV